MSQLKRVTLLVIASVFLVGISACSVLNYLEKEKEKNQYIVHRPSGVTTIQTLPDDRFVLVGLEKEAGQIILLQDFVVDYEQKIVNENFNQKSTPIGQEEYSKFYLYSIDASSTEPRVISVFDLLGQDNVYRSWFYSPFRYEGRDYLFVSLSHYEEGSTDSNSSEELLELREKVIVIDPQTGRLADGVPIEEMVTDNVFLDYGYTKMTDFQSNTRGGNLRYAFSAVLKEKYNLSLSTDGTINITPETDISGTNFAQLFPEEAKNFSKMTYLYMRPESFSTAEWLDKLFYWFAPAGQAGLEVEVTDNIVHDKTPIHSYAEYQAWLELHPKDKEMNGSSTDGN